MQLLSYIWLHIFYFNVCFNNALDRKMVNEIAAVVIPQDTVHTKNNLQKSFRGDPIVTSDSASCIIPFNRVGKGESRYYRR
jgi:hypothetical protein